MKRVFVVLFCLVAGGMASVPMAGAVGPGETGTPPGASPGAPPSSLANALRDQGSRATADPVIRKTEEALDRVTGRLGGKALDSQPEGVTSGARVSGPNFAKQKRRCRKIDNRKRSRACLKRVTQRQKRYQRQNRVRKMTFPVARREALGVAEYIYLELGMDGYEVGSCERLSRSKVRCFYMVWQDYVYDDDGSYADTMLCGDYATSRYDRHNRLKVDPGSDPICAWESEL